MDIVFNKGLLRRSREAVSVDAKSEATSATLTMTPFKRQRVMPPCGICGESMKAWGDKIADGVARSAIRAAWKAHGVAEGIRACKDPTAVYLPGIARVYNGVFGRRAVAHWTWWEGWGGGL